MRRPREFEARFGHVLDYMARVELEVDRNVLELTTMLPDPPEIDRHFYADVWQPQEIQHGLILDRLQVELGREPADADLDVDRRQAQDPRHAGPPRAVPGRLPDALLPDRHGHRALRGAGLQPAPPRHPRASASTAIADTVIGQIKRQEPGHFAFYQLSARGLWAELAAWQRWLVRFMRRVSFAPVGANNAGQKADLGDVMATLGIAEDSDDFAEPDLPASRRSCSGRATGASRFPTTSPAPSARPSSWPATGPTCRTCTADRRRGSRPVAPGSA